VRDKPVAYPDYGCAFVIRLRVKYLYPVPVRTTSTVPYSCIHVDIPYSSPTLYCAVYRVRYCTVYVRLDVRRSRTRSPSTVSTPRMCHVPYMCHVTKGMCGEHTPDPPPRISCSRLSSRGGEWSRNSFGPHSGWNTYSPIHNTASYIILLNYTLCIRIAI